MKIELNEKTMPDELYNMLLQHFVNKAVEQGIVVTKHSKFENWNIVCEVKSGAH